MAVDSLVTLPANVWTQLTNANATSITVIHRGGGEVIIRATVGAVAPAAGEKGGLPIRSGSDLHSSGFLKKTVTDLSQTALVTRVYAKALSVSAVVYVDTD